MMAGANAGNISGEATCAPGNTSIDAMRGLIDWSPNAAVVHRNGALLYVNPAATKLFGTSAAQDLIGQRILDLTHPDFHQAVTDRMLQSSRAGYAESISGEKCLRLDGTPFDAEIQSRAITYEGEPAVYTVIRDVTERLQSDAELRIAAIAFESQDGMFVTDANKIILRVNSAFSNITGYSADESIGKTPSILRSGLQGTAFYAAMWDSIQRIGAWHGEIWNRRKSGEIYPEQLTITSVVGSTGRVTNYVATMHDITQRKQLEEDVQRLAFYDPLTRLPNRRLFNDRLTQTLTRAKRSQSRMALMFIDLDKFKPINDEHGHEVGDWVLESVARRIESCLRISDTAARVGGDEFLVLLPDIKTSNDALAVAEKIRLEMERPFVTPSQLSLRASSSIGIAVYPDHASTEQDLLRLADRAMYQAKNSGGNNVQMCAFSSEPEIMDALAIAGCLQVPEL
jgi:diguanylate cyclase (GGDEF)-like protein/PAS domain S-box-containing protein